MKCALVHPRSKVIAIVRNDILDGETGGGRPKVLKYCSRSSLD